MELLPHPVAMGTVMAEMKVKTFSHTAVGLALILVMGLVGVKATAQTAEGEGILGLFVPVGTISDGSSAYAEQLRAYRLVNMLMRLGLPAFWIAEPFEYEDGMLPRGSFWVPAPDGTPSVAALAQELADRLGVPYTIVYARRFASGEPRISAFRLRPVSVAVYQGDRTYSGAADIASSLELVGVYPRYVTDIEIRRGALDDYDILVMPGGAQDVQSYALGPAGKANIRSFVESGGGYLGICAGAYLASAPQFELNLVDAPSQGRGVIGTWIAVRQRPGSHPLFRGYDDMISDLYYGGGPNFVSDHRAIAVLEGVPQSWKPGLQGLAAVIEDTCGSGCAALVESSSRHCCSRMHIRPGVIAR